MKIIKETQVLSTVHLSDTQKVVMSKIIASPTPQVANEEISTGRNTVVARDALIKLRLIEVSDDTVNVTETGQKVMKDENLTDDSGQLTDDGKQFAAVREPQDLKKVDDLKDAAAPAEVAAPAMDDVLPMESINLLRSIDRTAIENKIMELISIRTTI